MSIGIVKSSFLKFVSDNLNDLELIAKSRLSNNKTKCAAETALHLIEAMREDLRQPETQDVSIMDPTCAARFVYYMQAAEDLLYNELL